MVTFDDAKTSVNSQTDQGYRGCGLPIISPELIMKTEDTAAGPLASLIQPSWRCVASPCSGHFAPVWSASR